MQINGTTKKQLIMLESAWIFMLALACIFPFLFIILLVPIIAATVYFYTKNLLVNAVLLPFILGFGCVASGGDEVVVLFSVLCLLGVVGVLWGLKWRLYLIGAGITAVLMIAVSLVLPISYCLFSSKSLAEFSSDYVYEASVRDEKYFVPDNFIFSWAELSYLLGDTDDDIKLSSSDEGYRDEVIRTFSDKAWDWGKTDIFYYLLSFASLCGILSFLIVFLLNNKDLTRENLKNEITLFKIETEPISFEDMRLGHRYLIFVALPIFVLSFLGYIDSLEVTAAALNNAFITVPGAFAAFALMRHTINRFKTKSTMIAGLKAGWWGLIVLCIIFPPVLLAVSFFGIADAILNLRKLINQALEPSK